MPTDVLAPASSPTGVDGFLKSTLTAMKPTETISPAPANEKPSEKPVESKSTTPPAAPAKAEAAPPASPAPSDGEKPADALPPEFAAVKKQLGEQTSANKKLGRSNVELLQKNKQMAQEIQKLKEQFDPSYTPPAGPTPEQERAMIEFQAREVTSRKVAEERYGLEVVQSKIYAEDSPYQQLIRENPWQHHRVMASDNPVLEAFTVLDEAEVLNTFGRSQAAVLENVGKTLREQHWKEWTAQAKVTPADSPGKAVATLGEARGDGGGNEARQAPVFDLRTFNRHIA
ncbi:MAG: hypothetical protein OEW25_03785 [Nitrospira sp.]|nr:hypothetical protein [Nitrospira sp.]MDH5252425.1 hypothetical protein [Nitrospira sp.]